MSRLNISISLHVTSNSIKWFHRQENAKVLLLLLTALPLKPGPSVLLTVCVCVWQQEDPWRARVSDVRSQLRFLEEVESLKKKRKDEEEREQLLRLARVSEAKK